MPLPSGLHGLWWEIYCHSHFFLPIGKLSFFSGCFQDFPFVFSFQKFMLCLVVELHRFIFYRILFASWICRFMSLAKCGTSSAIISLCTFPTPNTSPPSGTSVIQMLYLLFYSHWSLRLSLLFSYFFFLCSYWVISITVSPSSLILSFIPSILLLNPSTELFIWGIFSVLKFPFGSL